MKCREYVIVGKIAYFVLTAGRALQTPVYGLCASRY